MPSSRGSNLMGGSSTKMTRRQIAMALTAVPALAQTTPPSTATGPAPQPVSSLEKAQGDVREVSERLRKIEIPMDLEPAFTFRP
jgi:hypothetical protein